MTAATIAVVGYASLDTTTSIATFRGVNATSILQRAMTTQEPGIGGIAHIVSACAATGVGTEAISWVGPDSNGERWSGGITRTGGGVAGIAIDGTRSPSATLIDIQAGGTICLFDPGDCHPSGITNNQAHIIATSQSIVLTVAPQHITRQILQDLPDTTRLIWAVKHDDDAYTPEMIGQILERADVVSFSEGEREYVTIGGREPERAVRPGALVIETRGASGVAWSIGSPDGPTRPAAVVVDSVSAHDTTGAGDTFIGTVAGLLANLPDLGAVSDQQLSEVITRATAAAGDLLRSRTTPVSDRRTTEGVTH
ncbi:MAG: PfkB family carbohydrate kinase [Rhodoglobus sp.]